jgi:hypothetical protein
MWSAWVLRSKTKTLRKTKTDTNNKVKTGEGFVASAPTAMVGRCIRKPPCLTIVAIRMWSGITNTKHRQAKLQEEEKEEKEE